MKKTYSIICLIGILAFSSFSFSATSTATSSLDLSKLSVADLDWIGDRIFQNEANRHIKYLTHWNEGEEFPSFGIGHFIWLPEDVPIAFKQTFPEMVQFVAKQVPAPQWLINLQPFSPPWKDRSHFYQVWHEQELDDLRLWLDATKSQQTAFIVKKLQNNFREKLAILPLDKYTEINQKIRKLAETKLGLFVIIDYHNFKGLGLNPNETYQGEGWGLLDVVLAMPSPDKKYKQHNSYEEVFVQTAKDLLERRISLSSPARNEQRWREGWFKRLDRNLLVPRSCK